jgi:hypothetical protein
MQTIYLSRSNQALLFGIVYHTVSDPETKPGWNSLALMERPIFPPMEGNEMKGYLSLTLQQGSIISSLAATLATAPLTMLLRYTIGVLPMSCEWTIDRQKRKVPASLFSCFAIPLSQFS